MDVEHVDYMGLVRHVSAEALGSFRSRPQETGADEEDDYPGGQRRLGRIKSTISDAFHDTRAALETTNFWCTPWDAEFHELSRESDNELDNDSADGEPRRREIVADMSGKQRQTRVDPYTTGLVICNRNAIPMRLLQTFPFIQDGCISTGFTYDLESGEIVSHHEDSENEDDALFRPGSQSALTAHSGVKHGYARLVTTNWWYSTLTFTCVLVSLIVMGKNGNLLFCTLLLQAGASPMPRVARWLVAMTILFLEGFQICIFYKVALKEFHSKSNERGTGDLVVDTSLKRKDKYSPLWALVLFHVLEVDVLVKDIIKYMHPFKDQQPYAAFKADGHRAFILGFRDVHSFYASHMQRPFSTLLTQIFIEALVLVFKVLTGAKTHNVAYCVMSLPGLFVIYLKTSEGFKRVKYRERYWKHLHAAYHYGDGSEKKWAEKVKALQFPDQSWDDSESGERTPLKLKMATIFLGFSMATYYLCFEAHVF